MPNQILAGFEKKLLVAFLFVTVCALAGLIGSGPAWAHGVNVFAYVEGDTVITESYFSDGRKCRDSTIEVIDSRGEKLLEGKTDAEGGFSFPAQVRDDLLIRLTAPMGHRAEYVVPATDLPADLPAAAGSASGAPGVTSGKAGEKGSHPPVAAMPHRDGPSMAEIEKAVDKAVARQLQPIRRSLEEAKARRRFSDIVGGVGYIIGLMGLAAYLRSRWHSRGDK